VALSLRRLSHHPALNGSPCLAGSLNSALLRSLPALLSGSEGICYTIASLNGQYAITGTYGANVAVALAMRYFDYKGNLTGTFVVDEPTPGSSTGARTIVTGTQVGTYTVNCDVPA